MPTREEMIAALRGSSKKPSREEMIAALRSAPAPEKGLVPESVRSEFERGDLLGPAIRVADAPGGFLRTGLANSAGILTGKGNIVTEEDLAKTAWGEAPSTAQYLERLGVPEGPSADLNPWMEGKTSARDFGGFLGDVVTSPAGVFKKAFGGANVASKGLEKAGENMYKSGLKNVDKKMVEKGTAPVSDVLLKQRKTGSIGKLAKDAEDIGRQAKGARDKLYQEAGDLGARIDVSGVVKNARKFIADLRKDKNLASAADSMETYLNNHTSEGFSDLSTVSQWKTNLYDALPDAAFGPNGRLKGPFQKFEKILAKDYKEAIEKGADEVAPGMGKKIKEVNQTMASTTSKTARKAMTNEVNKSITPNYLTVMDAMGPGGLGLLTQQMTGDPVKGLITGASALALKKGAEASRSTGFRTRGGLLLKDIGETALPDAVIQQGLIKSAKKKNDKRD